MMMTKRTLAALAACLCFELAFAVDPLVDLGYTKYQGAALPNGISQWLGIRFAAPPVGDLRFKAPADPPLNDSVQVADTHGPLCFGTGTGIQEGHSEDCLFLDVYAPSNATTDSNLPVMFFIQGGGLNQLSNANFNGSQLIEAAEFDMIVVTHNYRVGSFGFLASAEIQANGTINSGFWDQRKAMQWVQDNIEKFGGDPSHVVLSGDSAGAQSITIHLTAFGGADTDLFAGVIAESQSFPPIFNVSSSQFAYDALVERTNCTEEADTLACLRALDIDVLQNDSIAMPFPGRNNTPNFFYNAVVDGDLIPDIPYKLFMNGMFVDVPSVFGDDTNEGTIFTPTDLKTTSDLNNFLLDNFPFLNDSSLLVIDSLYPVSEQFPDHGENYFNAALAYGEMRYNCPGIFVSDSLRQFNTQPNWLYHYNVTDPTQVAEGEGVPHTVELSAIWGLNSTTGTPPASYFTTNANIIPVMQGYWTSFIRNLDPNPTRADGTVEWVQFDGVQRILFETNNTRMESIPDDQAQRCAFLQSIGVANQQ